MERGTIVQIRPNRDDGRGFGTIAPDGGGDKIAFDNRSTEGALRHLAHALRGLFPGGDRRERPFDRLRVGERVGFRRGEHPSQPHRAYAERVCPEVPRAGACARREPERAITRREDDH